MLPPTVIPPNMTVTFTFVDDAESVRNESFSPSDVRTHTLRANSIHRASNEFRELFPNVAILKMTHENDKHETL
jgi:hypothetical protein